MSKTEIKTLEALHAEKLKQRNKLTQELTLIRKVIKMAKKR